MLSLLLIPIFYFSLSHGKSIPISNCTTASKFAISNVIINPIPIKLNSRANISFDVNSLFRIEDNTRVEMTIQLGFLTISCSTNRNLCFDVCQRVKDRKVSCLINGNQCKQCPISPGKIEVRNLIVQTPPAFVLPGTRVNVKIQVFDPSRNLMGCIRTNNIRVTN